MSCKKFLFLLLPILIMFSCRNIYAHYGNHKGFVVDVCTINNVADLMGWHFETDEQFFARINREYETIVAEYRSIMDCFGIGIYERVNVNSQQQIHDVSEEVLLGFAHYIWNRNISYSDYLSRLQIKKCILESNVKEYRQRFDSKQFNIGHMVDHHIILNDLYKKEKLLSEVKLFLHYLEYHKMYFVSQLAKI